MNVYKNFTEYTSHKPLALSLGMFDGVHIGHKSIIDELTKTGQEKNLETAILTFWPHPRFVFNPDEDLKLLNTLEEKTGLMERYGIQNLFLKEFDAEFRNLTGEEFVRKILIDILNVKYLIIGYDHSFGKNKSGNFELLQKLSGELDFEVEQMEAINIHENNISSTKIRKALLTGNIKEANEMLGYSYSVSGTVVHGKKIGRTIGYPTANIETDSIKLLPKKGAYIVEVFVHGKQYKGMLSVGTNPTVNGEKLTVEVYILDFEGDIYGKDITVKFRDFLHDEIKFEGMDKLIERLDEDKRLTKTFPF
ncbi:MULTISPECIES: bifunctional riboflavin kinase/FAD synthetase [Chryseobacterium]|uniref:Riboflavin biosynthesis protein n=1 Tax=Chryseobacterium camelliae TaxID=1265445 RepID=A0ABU0TGW7_9FLAO|nr:MULTISPECIES: bifunctional riboflavin kinase/FAD synthetase [Chryseobacterium]MDT3405897.1 riboflavin kinase/FMN adenylyltransferase [Pseudacidovorax intermedius]MDQ1096299.1 riboflavin kinase/FMN adenylyltransferase [Chryseobacterium camelliae]MDQ1100237.1 riboflavin kinase/FMN adenylyltransferase [Chryseobacterium sp. SORGH_AS_1048]MDR6087581.1 riboflavin kinase/FMN adenylyltransferase [Chryseobacterium sp. SORGH_AS_0909]MDR6131955.1 riboflavin kinase/FMN adenylyltransferase [Chryseobacte